MNCFLFFIRTKEKETAKQTTTLSWRLYTKHVGKPEISHIFFLNTIYPKQQIGQGKPWTIGQNKRIVGRELTMFMRTLTSSRFSVRPLRCLRV